MAVSAEEVKKPFIRNLRMVNLEVMPSLEHLKVAKEGMEVEVDIVEAEVEVDLDSAEVMAVELEEVAALEDTVEAEAVDTLVAVNSAPKVAVKPIVA